MAESGGPNPAPIIVIKKKKKGHGGHHGGAWKVAYADFVTALMALFIVLWIVNTNQAVRDAVSGYFKDPKGYEKKLGSAPKGEGGEGKNVPKESLDVSKETMKDLKKKLEEAMKKIPELDRLKNQVEMIITNEGLRIELLETDKGVFFESGSPAPTRFGQELMEMLAAEIGKLPNHVLVEGHTDSKPYVSQNGYSNWELSADRANSARRIMQSTGLRNEQVSEVRGFADQRLRKVNNPTDASNRRISVTVKFPEGAAPGQSPTSPAPKTPPPEHAKH